MTFVSLIRSPYRWFIVLAAILIVGDPKVGLGTDASSPSVQDIQGRLICIPEWMHEHHGADLPTEHAHILGFHSLDGAVYTLLRTKLSEALFADKAMRDKELLLKGKVYPQSHVLDVTVMRSVRQGRIHDLYYWCDICAIKSVIPGTCMCCQEDVVLKEVPLEE